MFQMKMRAQHSMKNYEDFVARSTGHLPEKVSLERTPGLDVWRVRLGMSHGWRLIVGVICFFMFILCTFMINFGPDPNATEPEICCNRSGHNCHECTERDYTFRKIQYTLALGTTGFVTLLAFLTIFSSVILRVDTKTGNFTLQHKMPIGSEAPIEFKRDEAWVEMMSHDIKNKGIRVGRSYEFRVLKFDKDRPDFQIVFSVEGMGQDRNKWLEELINSIQKN